MDTRAESTNILKHCIIRIGVLLILTTGSFWFVLYAARNIDHTSPRCGDAGLGAAVLVALETISWLCFILLEGVYHWIKKRRRLVKANFGMLAAVLLIAAIFILIGIS